MSEKEFNLYFSESYGSRWTSLKAALEGEGNSLAYSHKLKKPYWLDSASVAAATALMLPARGEVLDACAAPGGKSLVIAANMGNGVQLLSNELSSDRRRRLVNVLDEHLPEELRARVKVSGFDAGAAGGRASERGRFMAILLDAPCSSERHVIKDKTALAKWSPARIRALAARQWSLLSSAFLLLAPGGSLVYSSCALSPEETDGPIDRLFKKYNGQFALDMCDTEHGSEPTKHGIIFLPDRANGAGPLYFSRIRKL